jgi:hypothetical protein
MYTQKHLIDKINKHINAVYPYTGEYIIDELSRKGTMSQNVGHVLEDAQKLYKSLCNDYKQVLDK